jgi:hypothetical protein
LKIKVDLNIVVIIVAAAAVVVVVILISVNPSSPTRLDSDAYFADQSAVAAPVPEVTRHRHAWRPLQLQQQPDGGRAVEGIAAEAAA